MKLRLAPARLILAAACLIQALALGTLAHSQDASAAPQAAPAQPAQSDPSAERHPTPRHTPPSRVETIYETVSRDQTYREFIWEIGGGYKGAEEKLAEGKQPYGVMDLQDLGIRLEAEPIIRPILIDAWNRLQGIEDEHSAKVVAWRERYYSQPRDAAARKSFLVEQDAGFQALSDERLKKIHALVEDVMAKLKQQLTPDDFKALDWYANYIGGGVKTVHHRVLLDQKQENPNGASEPDRPQEVKP
jgi:hypothetical protein